MNGSQPSVKKIINLIILLVSFSINYTLYANKTTKINSETSLWETTLYYLYQPIALFLPHFELRKKLYETETQYFHIVVEEDESGKYHLVFMPRKGSQSIYDPSNPDALNSNFMKNAFVSLTALNFPPKNALFIGMGGGLMAKYLHKHYPETNIDIVELDKAIPGIAEKYFGFKPNPNIKIHIQDGRVFVNKCKKKYDLIFIDVYNAYNIPFQFTTIEFYKQINRILSKNGICAVNLANMGKMSFISSELNTISKIFPDTFVLVCKNKTNYVPIITKHKINFENLNKKAIILNESKKFNINFQKLLENKITKKYLKQLKQENNTIITDDYAPIN